MTARTRIFVGILLVYAIGVAVLMWRLLADIDPRYRESAEESLVETAHLMASAGRAAQRPPALDTDVAGAAVPRPLRAPLRGRHLRRQEGERRAAHDRGRRAGHRAVRFAGPSRRQGLLAVARRQAGAGGPVRRAHQRRHRRRRQHLGDGGGRADSHRRAHRRCGVGGQAGAQLRPVHRGRAAQDADGRPHVGGRSAVAGGDRQRVAGAAVRAGGRLPALRAARTAPEPAAIGSPRVRHASARRSTRCATRWPVATTSPTTCRR